MRAHPRWTAAGAVVATAAALLVAGCDPAGGGQAAATCALATPPPASGSVDSAGIRVTEQGFSATDDEFPLVTIGAIVENTTAQVAYRTRLVFDAFDSAGTVVEGPQVNYKVIEVPIIQPGAKVAVGDIFFAKSRADVTRVTITPAVTAWMPPGNRDNGLAPITSTVVAGSGKRADDGSGQFMMTTKGDNCAALVTRGASMVWRDSAGAIVGGSIDSQTKLYACEPGDETPEVSITPKGVIPATADLDRTQVTPLCDLQPSRRVTASGEPVN